MEQFGKIFASFFSSSIIETALPTRFLFMSMIVLSDRDGRVDMTAQALARQVNMPLADVEKAIEELLAPDPHSRTREFEGRRLLPIDSERGWGWIVANKEQYYRRSSKEDTREKTAARVARHRARKREEEAARIVEAEENSSSCNGVTRDVTRGNGVERVKRHEMRLDKDLEPTEAIASGAVAPLAPTEDESEKLTEGKPERELTPQQQRVKIVLDAAQELVCDFKPKPGRVAKWLTKYEPAWIVAVIDSVAASLDGKPESYLDGILRDRAVKGWQPSRRPPARRLPPAAVPPPKPNQPLSALQTRLEEQLSEQSKRARAARGE